jgi:signal transduction histidine kinase
MTGLADNAGMRHGMELGADDYLPKPFTTDALYAAVDARLKKAQTVHDEAERKLAHLRDNISLMLPHELRTPLNGILAYGEIFAADADKLKPAEIAEMGHVVYQSGKRLERLIENFLIYSQLEVIAADPKNVNALRLGRTEHPVALIEKHALAQAAFADRSQDLSLELADTPLPMAEEYLSKVVDELTQNAFKFSEPGTAVCLMLSEAFNTIAFAISDQGRGFSSEQITRVGAYMQFDRTMQEQQGLGLGLVIAKRLVALHGGTLSIVSSPNSGAVISAKFPKSG